MYYIQAFLNSLYNPYWLRSNRKFLNKAGSYFLFFILFVSILQSAFLSFQLPKILDEFQNIVNQELPDFNATMTKGVLTVENIEQPFIHEFDSDEEKFLLVVNTQTEEDISIMDYLSSEADNGGLILSNKAIIHNGTQKKTETMYFSDLPDFETSKGEIVKMISKYSKGLPLIIFATLVLVLFFFMVIGKLIYLAIISLVVWFTASFAKKKWSYKEVYTVGLFAVTLPTLFSNIQMLFGRQFPFLYTILLLALMLGAIFYNKPIKTVGKDKKGKDILI